jgi:hypothetical protein
MQGKSPKEARGYPMMGAVCLKRNVAFVILTGDERQK